MYVCMYVHMYVCMYVRTYIRTYIRTYVHTYIHTYIHTYAHTYIHTFIRTHIRYTLDIQVCVTHTYLHIKGATKTTKNQTSTHHSPPSTLHNSLLHGKSWLWRCELREKRKKKKKPFINPAEDLTVGAQKEILLVGYTVLLHLLRVSVCVCVCVCLCVCVRARARVYLYM